MCCRYRVYNEGLNVCHVSEKAEDGKVIDELLCCVSISLDLESKDRSCSLGGFARYSTIFFAFSVWRSTRSESVSSPCKKMKAWNGETVAPVSRRSIARIYVTNAAAPTAAVKLTP